MKWDEIRQQFEGARDQLRREAQRLRASFSNNDARALSTFVRPNLGPVPSPLRRALEPVVALVAGVVLAVLMAFGLLHFGLFFLAAGLIYLILNKVFGLELDVNLPTP